MSDRKYGFVAFWKHSEKWYDEDRTKKEKFIKRVNEIFREAEAQGVKASSVYDCSWSSEWRYFSFWECPTLEILQDTLEKLVECGDINVYNTQHHYIGHELRNNDIIDSYNPDMFN